MLIVRLYQWVISPLWPANCRFRPTCSEYAIDALRLHGAWRGSWLTLRRLSSCHPLGRSGFDPVPPACSHKGCHSSHPLTVKE